MQIDVQSIGVSCNTISTYGLGLQYPLIQRNTRSYNKPEIPGQTVCYKHEFVISEQSPMRYCSTWLRTLLCYIKKFIIEEFVIRVFHCNSKLMDIRMLLHLVTILYILSGMFYPSLLSIIIIFFQRYSCFWSVVHQSLNLCEELPVVQQACLLSWIFGNHI